MTPAPRPRKRYPDAVATPTEFPAKSKAAGRLRPTNRELRTSSRWPYWRTMRTLTPPFRMAAQTIRGPTSPTDETAGLTGLRQIGRLLRLGLAMALLPLAVSAEPTPPPDPAPAVHFDQATGIVELTLGGNPVLTYHTRRVAPPPGVPDHYAFSGLIHPLRSPAGAVLTDPFPVGHRHQHGLFYAWTRATFRGDSIDFWNQQSRQGTVEHAELIDTFGPSESEDGSAGFRVRQRQVSHEHGTVLENSWIIRLLPVSEPYLLDITIEERPATGNPVVLDEYHYGGFAWRGPASWNSDDPDRFEGPMRVLTREGLSRRDSNHTRPGWVAAWGPTGSTMAGIAILDHPENFRYPQPIRVHPKMPYFVYSPPVLGPFTLKADSAYQSRYRIVLFDGGADPAAIETIFRRFTSRESNSNR